MKRAARLIPTFLSAAVLFLCAAVSAAGQSASLNTPNARTSETQYKINDLHFTRTPVAASVIVSVQDAGNVEIRTLSFSVPGADVCPSATFAGLLTAMANPAANETGTDTRKMSFRILTFLTTQGCLTGATLVP